MPFPKTYFLCPTSDLIHPPPVGPLCLGSILRSTSTPQFPLNRANVVPVTNANPTVVETDWRKTISSETGFGLGVYAQFLQIVTKGLGLGPDVEVEHSRRNTNIFAFDTVTTLSFEPTTQYVAEAVKAPAVRAYLREPRQKFAPVVSLFLVTSIKLVKGAKIHYLTSRTTTTSGSFDFYVAPIGTTIGPKGHWSKTNEDETEFKQDAEFVFAFRVKRLRFGRKVETEEYHKGALLTIGKGENDDEVESISMDDIDGSDLQDASFVPDEAETGNVYCIPA